MQNLSLNKSKRAQERTPYLSIGQVKYGLFKSMDCIIDNISKGGAKLRFADEFSAPRIFTLKIENIGVTHQYKCKVRWVSQTDLGVEFLSTQARWT